MGSDYLAHLVYNNTNIHLQNAITLFGLSNFTVVLIEIFEPDPTLSDVENAANLLAREQHWLNWLFSLPEEYRYNFAKSATAPMTGRSHSESKAKMSGEKFGSSNPRFGKVPVNATNISVYTIENILVQTFPSQVEAAKFLGVSFQAVSLAIKRDSIIKKLYKVQLSGPGPGPVRTNLYITSCRC